MKRNILLLIAGFILFAACSNGHYTNRGLVKPKKSKKCGTCPTW